MKEGEHMMNAKMTFVHYSREDVIATSAISDEFCPSFGATHYQIVSRNNPQSKPGQGIFVYNVYEYSYDAVNGLVPMSDSVVSRRVSQDYNRGTYLNITGGMEAVCDPQAHLHGV